MRVVLALGHVFCQRSAGGGLVGEVAAQRGRRGPAGVCGGAAHQCQVGVQVLAFGAVPAGQFWLHPLEGTCAVAAHPELQH